MFPELDAIMDCCDDPHGVPGWLWPYKFRTFPALFCASCEQATAVFGPIRELIWTLLFAAFCRGRIAVVDPAGMRIERE